MKKSVFLSLTLLITALGAVHSQNTSTQANLPLPKSLIEGWSISAAVGYLIYSGDIKSYNLLPIKRSSKGGVSERNWGLGLNLTKKISTMMDLRAQILVGRLSGFESDKKEYFKAPTASYSANMIINLNNLILGTNDPTKSYFYWSLGVGVVQFRSTRRILGSESPSKDDVVIQDYGFKYDDGKTKDKKTTEATVPLGIGFSYPINSKLDFYVDRSIRFVKTDKLDAKVAFGDKDLYNFTSIGLTIRL